MNKVIRIFLNIILFIIYSLISMNIVNFIYDLILNLSGNIVPPSNDPVHLKIAGITFFIVILFTLVFRKYFYLKVFKENIIEEKEEAIKSISFEEIDKKVDEERKSIPSPLHSEGTKLVPMKGGYPLKKEEIKEKKKVKKEVNVLKEGDMEIFMGKEIK